MDTTPSIPLPVGLSSKEARTRLLKYGENEIYRRKKLRPIVAFIRKFNSPIFLILAVTALMSFFLGEKTNAVIIIFIAFMSVTLDFMNSYHSEKIVENLIKRVASSAAVFRDGLKKEIPLRLIVPGDILELSAGNTVPADCYVMSADDFFINEAALTGESFPVEKYAAKDAELEKRTLSLSGEYSVFMGMSVVTGTAIVKVVSTGMNTEFGKIAKKLADSNPETGFEKEIRSFSMFIMRATLFMVTVVFAVNAYLGHGIIDSLLFSVAIAVGLTPELLPMIMSITLSRGSAAMAKKNVIVKDLSAMQNFGSINILCTDKTGTLTENKIHLIKCVDIYEKESADVLLYGYLSSVYHTAHKSPLDTAIQEHGKMDLAGCKKIDEIPFDFTRRRDSIVVERNGKRFIITKGAPESILSASSLIKEADRYRPIEESLEKIAIAEYDKLSSGGFRVLGIAIKEIPVEEKSRYDKKDECDMAFLGFAAFLDPPKKSAGEAIRDLALLAVETKIITGDSDILTKKICSDLGINIKAILTGDDIAKMPDSELEIKALETTVFARMSPEQKERVVLALRRSGNVVGYLGDGINDAPVLKAADIGISVNNAVDVAKETADIILLSKNLEVLKDGIIEGRKTFQNTLKYIKIGISSNFGNMFSMMGASLILPFLPMLPSQVLFNNFIYDVSQTALPTDRIDSETTKRPLRWNMRDFTKYIIIFGMASSIFDFLTFFILYKFFHLSEAHFQTGWFIESIATQTLVVFIIRTKRVPFFKSPPSPWLIASVLGVVALAWITPYTALGRLLSFDPLPNAVLISIICIIIAYLSVAEIVKYFFYKKFRSSD